MQIVCHALVSVLQEHFGHGQNHDLEIETVFSPGPSLQFQWWIHHNGEIASSELPTLTPLICVAQVKLSCQAPFFLDMTLPEQAILIRQPWVDRILEPNECFRKTWEIRSFATQKRGKFAVAVVGEKHILGEVELTDCFQVAEKVDGCWCPVSDEAPFLFDPDNAIKCGFDMETMPDYFASKSKLFAWVLRNARRYDQPIKWSKKDGAVVFANVESDKSKKDKKTDKKHKKDKTKSVKKNEKPWDVRCQMCIVDARCK